MNRRRFNYQNTEQEKQARVSLQHHRKRTRARPGCKRIYGVVDEVQLSGI